MSWITENPWPLVLILGGISLVLLILGEPRLRSAALACLLLTVVTWVTESLIVTPSEHIEDTVQQMLDCFLAQDQAGIDALIDDGSPALRDTARSGLEQVELHQSFHVKDIAVVVADDGESANVELRANGTLTHRQSNSLNFASTRWRTIWKKSSAGWKLAEVRRLNPLTGEEIGVMAVR